MANGSRSGPKSGPQRGPQRGSQRGPVARGLAVLFEDKWLVVISKPAGMLSVGYPGFRGKTAQDVLAARYPGRDRIACVHRLDRDTSGVMVYARGAEAKKRMMSAWSTIVTERTYRCVALAPRDIPPLADEGTIDAPLAYNVHDVAYVPRPSDARARADALHAVTRYRVLARGSRADLVECELETGRKNQIRAHLAYLGHPIAGDEVYGRGAEPHGHAANRLALHARVLAFVHPFTGAALRFEEPEPAFFAREIGAAQSAARGAAQGAAQSAARGAAQGATRSSTADDISTTPAKRATIDDKNKKGAPRAPSKASRTNRRDTIPPSHRAKRKPR
jgi:23S rRNA pseudouridine1911/1915/1917 synthase